MTPPPPPPPPRPWHWLNADALQAVDLEHPAEHGGGAGTRIKVLLDAGFSRPQHLARNGETDAFELAACAFGIDRDHPFIDGNKRAADDPSATLTMLCVAAGDIDEPSLAQWLRGHSAPH